MILYRMTPESEMRVETPVLVIIGRTMESLTAGASAFSPLEHAAKKQAASTRPATRVSPLFKRVLCVVFVIIIDWERRGEKVRDAG